jgi:hypothetical protein
LWVVRIVLVSVLRIGYLQVSEAAPYNRKNSESWNWSEATKRVRQELGTGQPAEINYFSSTLTDNIAGTLVVPKNPATKLLNLCRTTRAYAPRSQTLLKN